MFMKRIQVKLFIILLLIFFAGNQSVAQSVKMLTSGTKTSIRGLSVVNDKVIWVSGSKGTVGISTDSGLSWRWTIIKGFENTSQREMSGTMYLTGKLLNNAKGYNITIMMKSKESKWQIITLRIS